MLQLQRAPCSCKRARIFLENWTSRAKHNLHKELRSYLYNLAPAPHTRQTVTSLTKLELLKSSALTPVCSFWLHPLSTRHEPFAPPLALWLCFETAAVAYKVTRIRHLALPFFLFNTWPTVLPDSVSCLFFASSFLLRVYIQLKYWCRRG